MDRQSQSPQLGEHGIGGVGEVGNGVEQRAVEVDEDGFYGHQTFASSARSAAMMEL